LTRNISFILFALAAAFAQTRSIKVDVAQEKPGAEPTHFLGVVGHWVVTQDGTRSVLMEDGRQWKKNEPSGGLADKARAIYGSRHEEFIDNVKAFAYYPYAVAQGVDNFSNGEISVRFQMVDGALDRCSGILFDLKPSGDYLTVRYNGTEDNVVLWTFNKGVRRMVKRGAEEMPIKMKEWATLKIAVHGTHLEAFLNGKQYLDYTLSEAVSGRVGVWSKTDSVSLFDDFTVTPAP
jgi:hypothetical protein